MQFGGRYRFKASRLHIWAALNDAEILKNTIPGCTRIVWIDETSLEAVITVDLGVAKPTFSGIIEMHDVTPAVSYTLFGYGKGGLLGHAHGRADVTLTDDGDDCILAFIAEGGASNAIMKFGKKLIGRSAQRVIDHFFMRFAKAVDVDMEVLDPDSGRFTST